MPRSRASAQSSLAGKQIADRAGQMREADQLGARRDRLGVGVEVVLHARVRVLLRNRHHREAEALRLLVPRRQVAGMVVLKDDDLVAGLELDAARDHVVGLAGVAGDDDLFRRHAQEGGERLAEILLLAVQPRAVLRRRILVDAVASRASALRAPGARRGRGWRRSAPRGRAASRTARAPTSRTLRRCRRWSGDAPLAWPDSRAHDRIGKQRRGSADGEQSSKVATGNGCGHRSLRAHSTPEKLSADRPGAV